ncbi:MAG: hypothetical protein ACK4MT_04065, partial [Thermaurantiacus tibetensis]
MIVLDETPSTSDWLLARVAELPDGTWVRARRQTAGRGRQGRPWQMAEGNLAASGLVRLRPGDPPAEQLGFVAGVALHRVASAHAPEAGILLKWPNDLLLRGAKLAGILLDRAGDHVVVANPTFLGALQSFNSYEARYITVPIDEEGMSVTG